MKAKHGTLNVHRADCNRQHANPCDPWPERLPRLVKFINAKMRCSSYSFQECLPDQAVDITTALGWGTSRNPAWWADENFNVVAADRSKWTDLFVAAASLLKTVGDVGDRNRRSALFVRMHRLDVDVTLWLGAAHLETGNPAARALQAQQLADAWPRDDRGLADVVLGIDRNSYTLSKGQPRDVLARAGIREALPTNPTRERSFNGFGTPEHDGKNIDGLHYTGRHLSVRSAELASTVGTRATDHSGLVLAYDLKEN